MIIINALISIIIGSVLWFAWLSFRHKKAKARLKNTHLNIDPLGFTEDYLFQLKSTCENNHMQFWSAYPDIYLCCCDDSSHLANMYRAISFATKRTLEEQNIFFINEKNSVEPTYSIREVFAVASFEVSSFELISFILQNKTITIVFASGKHELVTNSFGVFVCVQESCL